MTKLEEDGGRNPNQSAVEKRHLWFMLTKEQLYRLKSQSVDLADGLTVGIITVQDLTMWHILINHSLPLYLMTIRLSCCVSVSALYEARQLRRFDLVINSIVVPIFTKELFVVRSLYGFI